MMGIKKVWRDDTVNTCVACMLCQSFAPRVFKVFGKMVVMPDVDYNKYELEIREAAESCPTGIIKIEEEK
ncbi:ferredoxin [Saccharicrinis sp. GN24d3]|uniref:ferredoxin n=1 Tax=Saccharicrinis sp. GN24d3 TaxID=3458416 RepID=UPI0040368B4C